MMLITADYWAAAAAAVDGGDGYDNGNDDGSIETTGRQRWSSFALLAFLLLLLVGVCSRELSLFSFCRRHSNSSGDRSSGSPPRKQARQTNGWTVQPSTNGWWTDLRTVRLVARCFVYVGRPAS